MKLSRALCKLACIPDGGSLVILMDAWRIPCGMICDSGVPAGSALMYNLYASWLPVEYSSTFFSSLANHFATRWTFCENEVEMLCFSKYFLGILLSKYYSLQLSQLFLKHYALLWEPIYLFYDQHIFNHSYIKNYINL